jgi:hypothetical protein
MYIVRQFQLLAQVELAEVIFATRLKTDLSGSQVERASSLGSKQARSIVRWRKTAAAKCNAAH